MRTSPDLGILHRELPDGNTDQFDADVLLAMLKRIRARYDLKTLLANITARSELSNQVIEHSYPHNNGFDKFVIDAIGEFGLKLRLHVWWDCEARPRESTVNDHPWDFASSVLLGQITMRRYQEGPGATTEYIRARYPTKAMHLDRRIVLEGTSHLSCLDESVFNPNSYYALPHSELHSVAVEGVAATLVLQGRHVNSSTRVFSRTTEGLREPFEVNYFTVEEVLSKLKCLSSLLG
jgi:hypothetical protein